MLELEAATVVALLLGLVGVAAVGVVVELAAGVVVVEVVPAALLAPPEGAVSGLGWMLGSEEAGTAG